MPLDPPPVAVGMGVIDPQRPFVPQTREQQSSLTVHVALSATHAGAPSGSTPPSTLVAPQRSSRQICPGEQSLSTLQTSASSLSHADAIAITLATTVDDKSDANRATISRLPPCEEQITASPTTTHHHGTNRYLDAVVELLELPVSAQQRKPC